MFGKKEVIVCKFGGTSLASPESISRVREIIRSDPRRKIIVVSAPGKRDKNDTKLTDLLFEIHKLMSIGRDYDRPYNEFARRFYEIERAFGVKTDLKNIMEEFYREIPGQNVDFVTSTGEYFMAKVMAAILGFEFVDIDKTGIISFDKDGKIDLKKSNFVFEENYKGKRIVVPGFYGVLSDGKIKTFSRGGSDISGAIMASISGATVYENWTDVDGVYDRDPNKYPDAKKFDIISYDEVESLARSGANVLHPDCVWFCRVKNIPIVLRNTFKPSVMGTVIR